MHSLISLKLANNIIEAFISVGFNIFHIAVHSMMDDAVRQVIGSWYCCWCSRTRRNDVNNVFLQQYIAEVWKTENISGRIFNFELSTKLGTKMGFEPVNTRFSGLNYLYHINKPAFCAKFSMDSIHCRWLSAITRITSWGMLKPTLNHVKLTLCNGNYNVWYFFSWG